MNLSRHIYLWAALICVNAQAGNLYIYQAPNGEQIVSDRRLNQINYRLVYSSKSAEDTGRALRQGLSATQDMDSLIQQAAIQYGVDKSLIRAVIKVESNFNANAISVKGAQGLMQLMPATARQYRVTNPYDAEQNIVAGTKHLRYLIDRFDNTRLALAAYNAGETPVIRYKDIPPYPETREYVSKVISWWKKYQ